MNIIRKEYSRIYYNILIFATLWSEHLRFSDLVADVDFDSLVVNSGVFGYSACQHGVLLSIQLGTLFNFLWRFGYVRWLSELHLGQGLGHHCSS